MRTILSILIFCILNISVSFSQTKRKAEPDSLLKELEKAKDDQKAALMNKLSMAYLNISREKSKSFAHEALKFSRKKKQVTQEIEALNQLARLYLSISTDSSIVFLEQALSKAKETNNLDQKAVALHNFGLAYYYKGDYQKTLDYWQKGLEAYKQLGINEKISLSLNNIGVVYKNWGKYDKAISYYQQALRIQEEIGDTLTMARLTNNIGNVYYFFGDNYKDALEYYEKGLKLFQAIGNKKETAFAMNSVGLVYQKWKKENKKAEKYFRDALKISNELNYLPGQARSLNNIGNNYMDQKRYSDALEYCLKALELNKKIGAKKETAFTTNDLGEIYLNLKQYDKALVYFSKGVEDFKKFRLKKELINLYKKISETHAAKRDFEKAYLSYQNYSVLKDSIFTEDQSKQITEMQTKYETEKKERENVILKKDKALQDKEIDQQNMLIRSFVVGIVFLLLFAFILFRNYRIIQKNNRLLAYQRDEILKQRNEIEEQRNIATSQRDKIAQQSKHITDSIVYASRIQTAILPPEDFSQDILPEHFILFKPRDIVSGDFFWMTKKTRQDGSKITIIAAADCTGHGVPGAFMSMLGISFLNEIVNTKNDLDAAFILTELRKIVKKSLRQTGKEGEAKDGMDIALCIFDESKENLQYAGAYNPLVLIRNDEISQIKADKMPIGIHIREKSTFTNHELELQKGDTIYLFSDGYADQIGGEKGRKFMSKNFRNLLFEIQPNDMHNQKLLLDEKIENWKNHKRENGEVYEQIDDILVVGLRF